MAKNADNADYFKVIAGEGETDLSQLLLLRGTEAVSQQEVFMVPYRQGTMVHLGSGTVRVRANTSDEVQLQWPGIAKGLVPIYAVTIALLAIVVPVVGLSLPSVSGMDLLKRGVMVAVYVYCLICLVARVVSAYRCPPECLVYAVAGGIRMHCKKLAMAFLGTRKAAVECECHAIVVTRYETPLMKYMPFFRGSTVRHVSMLVNLEGYIFQLADGREKWEVIHKTEGLISASEMLSRLPLIDAADRSAILIGALPGVVE